jgi:hypothetical protein
VGTEPVRRTLQLQDADEERLLREIAAPLGVAVEAVKIRAPDPSLIVYLVGTAALVALAVERFHERRKGGQLVDLRPGASQLVRRDQGILYGYVVILTGDGQVRVEVKEPENQLSRVVTDVLSAVAESQAASVEQLAELVATITGGEGEVTVSHDRAELGGPSDAPAGQPDRP